MISNLRPMAGARTGRFSADHEIIQNADTLRGMLYVFFRASLGGMLLLNAGGRDLLSFCALRNVAAAGIMWKGELSWQSHS